MSSGKRPGIECRTRGSRAVNDGTLCRQASAAPGTVGAGWSFEWRDVSNAWDSTTKWVDETASSAGRYLGGRTKSLLLSLLDTLPLKQESPVSTALLKHYVEGSGDRYVIDPIPTEWQDWIV